MIAYLVEDMLAPTPTELYLHPAPSRHDELTVRITVMPASGDAGTEPSTPSTRFDNLADATWEDAEWQ